MRFKGLLKDLILPGFWLLFLIIGAINENKDKTTGRLKEIKTDTTSVPRAPNSAQAELTEEK